MATSCCRKIWSLAILDWLVFHNSIVPFLPLNAYQYYLTLDLIEEEGCRRFVRATDAVSTSNEVGGRCRMKRTSKFPSVFIKEMVSRHHSNVDVGIGLVCTSHGMQRNITFETRIRQSPKSTLYSFIFDFRHFKVPLVNPS